MAIELDDGTIIRSLPEQVTKNKEDVEDLQDGLTALEQQVASALAGVFHYKGSVATYGDLPSSGNEVGDVWNVLADGKNYAWSGSGWDDLGGIVDLSNYVTLDGAQTISGAKTFSQTIDATNGVTFGQGGVITDLQAGIRFTDYNSVSLDYENGALFPAITNTIDLGSSTNTYKDIYLSGAIKSGSVIDFYVGNNQMFRMGNNVFRPTTTNTEDLGSIDNSWNVAYINEIRFSKNPSTYYILTSGNNLLIRAGGSPIVLQGLLRPYSNNDLDIGSSSYAWKDLYLGGKIVSTSTYLNFEVSGSNKFQVGSSNSTFATRVIPWSDNLYDLGYTTNKWKDIYLSGNLSDGTNSVNIADLKALIDYAKAQGWIS